MDADHLQPDFDPNSVRVADLRGILLQHLVPYSSTAKKADLVQLYETNIRPQAKALLAKSNKVRASSLGIEDARTGANATSGSKSRSKPSSSSNSKGLPSSASSNDLLSPKGKGMSSRKSASMHNLAAAAAAPSGDSEPLPMARKPAAPRRSVRRSASVEMMSDVDEKASDADMEEAPSATTVKRRGRPKKSAVAQAPETLPMTIDEDDEPVVVVRAPLSSPSKTPVVEIPRSKVRKSLSTKSASQKRTSEEAHLPPIEDEGAVESGFSDYNPFQSGDDASPETKEKRKKRRKSSLGPNAAEHYDEDAAPSLPKSTSMQNFTPSRKSMPFIEIGPNNGADSQRRKSTLSTTQTHVNAGIPSLSSSKSVPSFTRYMAPLEGLKTAPEDFKLVLKEAEQERRALRSPEQKPRTRASTSPERKANLAQEEDEKLLESLAAEPAFDDEEEEDDEAPVVVSVSKQDSEDRMTPARKAPAPPGPSKSTAPQEALAKVSKTSKAAIKRVSRPVPKVVQVAGVALPLLSIAGGYGNYWAAQKRSLGFCDTDSTLNRAVLHRRAERVPTEMVSGQPESTFDKSLQEIYRALTPDTCEPCPSHAICKDGEVVACERDYILRPNPLADLVKEDIKVADSVLPLVLKPTCKPDTERLVRIAETASQIAKHLREVKGDIICKGEERAKRRESKNKHGGKAEDWAVFGESEDYIKKVITEVKDPRIPDAQWDDIFAEAVQDLIGHSEIVHGIDEEAEAWLAAVQADLPLACRTKLAVYKGANEHKATLASILGLLLSALYGRVKLAQRKYISEQVDELVPIALQLLQQQEQNHHIDPVSTQYPYLAPTQLRDLVLSHEHSPSRRAELWKRVEKVVEGNSNVRARIAEQRGEELRVWEWVGGAIAYIDDGEDAYGTERGTSSAVKRRRSYGALGTRSSLSRPGTPRSTPGRHISWGEDVKSPTSATPPKIE